MPIVYEEFKPGEELAVNELVMNVFNLYIAPDYSEEGRKTFQDFVEPRKFLLRFLNGTDLVLLAKSDGKIIGVLDIKENDHISLLFVDPQYQRRGIARALFHKALNKLKARRHGIISISVNSSPYAQAIYQRLGFQKTGEEQEQNGIRFVPMATEV